MTDSDPDPHSDPDSSSDADHSPDATERRDGTRSAGHPIDGNALLLAAAKASVGPERLPKLLRTVAAELATRRADYGRRFEAVHERDGTLVVLVPEGHWADLGGELGIREREADALRRAHEEHLRRLGSQLDRREEFEHALELREAVVVGTE